MPTMYLTIGPQGSGKTTYCVDHLRAVPPEEWTEGRVVRISQDEMGKFDYLVQIERCIGDRRDFVIDRINHRMDQRLKSVVAAREAGYRIIYVWFNAEYDICLDRVKLRRIHPTIKPDDDHLAILHHYFDEFNPPHASEYDQLVTINVKKLAKVLDLREVIGTKRWMVVGDIHGCFDELTQLLSRVEYDDSQDILISAGDLTDRGPASAKCLDFFFAKPGRFVVEGNHDNKLKRLLFGSNVKVRHGLDMTWGELQALDDEGRRYVSWLRDLPQIIRVPDWHGVPQYVVHAGIDPRIAVSEQRAELCRFVRYLDGHSHSDSVNGVRWYDLLDGKCRILCGHSIHEIPFPNPHVVCLDGGCFAGGTLRALVNGEQLVTVQSEYNWRESPQLST